MNVDLENLKQNFGEEVVHDALEADSLDDLEETMALCQQYHPNITHQEWRTSQCNSTQR